MSVLTVTGGRLDVLTVTGGRYRASLDVVGRFTPIAVEAEADAPAQEDAMYLGGSRDSISQGHRADGTYRLRESQHIVIDHDALPAGWRWVIHVEGRRDSGVTCVPKLHNVTDAVTTDGVALGTSESRQTIVVPTATGEKEYEGRVTLTGADQADAFVTMQAIREVI